MYEDALLAAFFEQFGPGTLQRDPMRCYWSYRLADGRVTAISDRTLIEMDHGPSHPAFAQELKDAIRERFVFDGMVGM